MKTDDAAVNLQSEDMPGSLGQRDGQGPQADPYLDDHILFLDSTCLDDGLGSPAMNKKILAETLFGREAVLSAVTVLSYRNRSLFRVIQRML